MALITSHQGQDGHDRAAVGAFRSRGVVSLLVAGGFLVMSVSGVMLFLSPPGRIAHWVDWTLLGLTKDQWSDLHIVAGTLFLVTGVWHLINNWKPFLHHLRTRVQGVVIPRREAALAVGILILLAAGTLLKVPPLSSYLALNDTVRAMWAPLPRQQPPFGHAEEVSLAALAYRTHKSPEVALATLESAGLSVPGGQRMTLRRIADVNHVTPARVYALLDPLPEASSETVSSQMAGDQTTAQAASGGGGGASIPAETSTAPLTAAMIEARFAGRGVGRRTLLEVAQEMGQPVEALLWRLSRAGLDARPSDRLKPLAEVNGRTPLAILVIGLMPVSEDSALE